MDVLDKEIELEAEAQPVIKDPAVLAQVEEMMKAGLFIGRRSSKTHPRMRPLICGIRNGISMIDLEETLVLLNKAVEFVGSKVAKGGEIFFVGTTPAARNSVEELAKKLSFPYVVERWLGGTLTNFKTLSKRVAYFKKLKSDKEAGRLDKYTKKERLDIDREIIKLTKMFSGVEHMDALPKVVFVVDVSANMIAVREAKRLGIPVVGVANTDVDPEIIDYLIPANDRSKSSIDWILNRFEKVMADAKAEAKSKQPVIDASVKVATDKQGK